MSPKKPQDGSDHAGDWQQLADSVRAYRLRKDWTQADLAAAAGVSETTIQNIEAGRGQTRLPNTMSKIEEALGWGAGSARRLVFEGAKLPSEVSSRAPGVYEVPSGRPAPVTPVEVRERFYNTSEEVVSHLHRQIGSYSSDLAGIRSQVAQAQDRLRAITNQLPSELSDQIRGLFAENAELVLKRGQIENELSALHQSLASMLVTREKARADLERMREEQLSSEGTLNARPRLVESPSEGSGRIPLQDQSTDAIGELDIEQFRLAARERSAEQQAQRDAENAQQTE